MRRIRIVTAGLPRVLSDIIREVVSADADMEIVADVASIDELAGAVRRTGANRAILELDNASEFAIGRFLLDMPGVRVMTITTDGRRGFLYELLPRRVPLGELSPPSLLRALRETPTVRAMEVSEGSWISSSIDSSS